MVTSYQCSFIRFFDGGIQKKFIQTFFRTSTYGNIHSDWRWFELYFDIYTCDILGIFKPLFFDAVLGSQIWENSICLEQNEPFADPLTKSLLILREERNLPKTKDIYHHLVLDVDRVKKSASRVNLNQSFMS